MPPTTYAATDFERELLVNIKKRVRALLAVLKVLDEEFPGGRRVPAPRGHCCKDLLGDLLGDLFRASPDCTGVHPNAARMRRRRVLKDYARKSVQKMCGERPRDGRQGKSLISIEKVAPRA